MKENKQSLKNQRKILKGLTSVINTLEREEGMEHNNYLKNISAENVLNFIKIYRFKKLRPGTVAYACDASTLGGQGRWII